MKRFKGFLITILVILLCPPSLIFYFCLFCWTHFRSCYNDCPTESEKTIIIAELGSVSANNNEVCKIEEIRERTIYYVPDAGDAKYNDVDHCINNSHYREKPRLRRIICPSGQNGQSTITDDGTKFHREVLR
jgi:hypothetical protein